MRIGIFIISLLLLAGCSPVKLPVNSQYQLSAYSVKKIAAKTKKISLLVTSPEAVSGYQTAEMRYIKKAFLVESFAQNAWVDSPANMLYPLLVQSLQRSGYFYAVSSSPYVQAGDYRLDTQVLSLEQNFLKKPSTLHFSIKVVLTRISDNKIVASRIMSQEMACPMDTPYGGVLAANKASLKLTADVVQFVVSSIKYA